MQGMYRSSSRDSHHRSLSAICKQQLRIAISLNNAAVTLFERNCYNEAHNTIQNAARVMMQLEDLEEPSLSMVDFNESIQEWMQLANEQLAQLQSNALSIPFNFMCDERFIGPAYPMRIEWNDCEYENASDLWLQSTMIIHNAGLSFFFQACLAGSAATADILVATAIRLFKTAYENYAVRDDFLTCTCMIPVVNTLTALAKSFFAAGLLEDMEECFVKLEIMRKIADEVCMTQRQGASHWATAAAAA
jgi:hypothetical protein